MILTNTDLTDLKYDLDDYDIINDVLAIVGAAGSEQLVRGVDEGSGDKYGRRSLRLDRPIGYDVSTVQSLVTAALDRYIEPYAKVNFRIIGTTTELITAILELLISDKVTITIPSMGLSADFIIETINLEMSATDTGGIIKATYDAVQARANE